MITTNVLAADSGKARLITLWILSGLVALAFLGTGGAKLAGAAAMTSPISPGAVEVQASPGSDA